MRDRAKVISSLGRRVSQLVWYQTNKLVNHSYQLKVIGRLLEKYVLTQQTNPSVKIRATRLIYADR